MLQDDLLSRISTDIILTHQVAIKADSSSVDGSSRRLVYKLEGACSVMVWCTKIARILRTVVQTGANLADLIG